MAINFQREAKGIQNEPVSNCNGNRSLVLTSVPDAVLNDGVIESKSSPFVCPTVINFSLKIF